MYVISEFMLKNANPKESIKFHVHLTSWVSSYIWEAELQLQEQRSTRNSLSQPSYQRKIKKMPKQSAPVSRSVFTRNLASKRGSTWRPYVSDVQHKQRRPMRTKTSKKDMKVVEHFFEDDIVVSPPPKGPRDLRFTIPDVPANRDLLSFLNTRAHDMMGEVVRELHTVTKIKVLLLLFSSARWIALLNDFLIAQHMETTCFVSPLVAHANILTLSNALSRPFKLSRQPQRTSITL
jgi:hypothetical protein